MLNYLEVLSNVAIEPALFIAKDNAIKLFIGRSFVFIAANSLAITSIGIIAIAIFVVYKLNKPGPALNIHVNQENSIFGTPSLPQEVFNEVLKHNKSNFVATACVSKQFNAFTNDYAKNNLPAGRFCAKEWKSYGGDPGVEPVIPLKMYDFDSSKWMLTLIPERINGELLTLSGFDRFVSDYKNGKDTFKSNYRYRLSYFGISDKTVKPFKAHWVMLSKDVLDGTRNKSFATQQKLVKEAGFEIPNLVDTVVSVLLHNLETDEFCLPAELNVHQWTFTRVQEQRSRGYQIVVGGFSALGLIVNNDDYGDVRIGASCARKSIGT